MKSIYLNNSKYSNNLRHSLRIFFEREVKTKHTPALFGSTFKGSKWVDYQTFNINKLFIKSGLYYFYYILIIFSLTLFLLGRSKSEQYFGFFPFFTYINFLLGYIPLILSDLTSQVILVMYTLYTLITSIVYRILNQTTQNILLSLKSNYKLKTQKYISKENNPQYTILFSTNTPNSIKNNITPNFSKILSIVKKDINYLNFFNLNTTTYNHLNLKVGNSISYNTLTLKSSPSNYETLLNTNTLSSKESYYLNSNSLLNFKIKTLKTDLNTILKLTNRNNTLFNFNLETNLNTSKQQRWFTRNSLLGESIIPNSFLITQSKKLIGSGILDKDFSNKTL
jgi:hypothetical protein